MSSKDRRSTGRLHARPIEDYAIVGDCETAALIARTGSIDWLCWPRFSSNACFAALLGTADHGFWKIAPSNAAGVKITRRYVPSTLVLETTFTTRRGVVQMLDFMPPREKAAHLDAHSAAPLASHLVRLVRCLSGRVRMRMDLAIRFDYGRTVPWVTRTADGLRAIAGPDMLLLRTPVKVGGKGLTSVSEFTLAAGEEMPFTLTYTSSMGADGNAPTIDPRPLGVRRALAQTTRFWKRWARQNTHHGEFRESVERSLMTLKAMTYRPSGGIVAAITTSLPEKAGGERNWDYRFCWLRDTAFTLLTLLHAGYVEEAEAWRQWLLRAIAGSPGQLQSLYGICGERQAPEWTADWLPGYEDSRPVRIGNQAVDQFQLDVYGEVAAALAQTPTPRGDLKVSASALQAQLIDHLCRVWTEPDEGIWEVRGPRRHFTHSKVMAWVALDRAIRFHEQFDGGGDVKRWRKNRDLLFHEICEKAFNKRLNSFTQFYGSEELDASCLRIGLVGFLPMDDPRIVGTVEAIEQRLMKRGFVERYDTRTAPDGLPAGEGAFLACSFWLVTCLWLIGRQDDARALYARLLALRNDVGLLSEEYDPGARRMLGNFPQALSHIAMTQAAFAIAGTWHPSRAPEQHSDQTPAAPVRPAKKSAGRKASRQTGRPRHGTA